MRDLLLLGLLPFLIYYAVKRPFIGLSLWLWSSLVPLQSWSYGVATSIRWNLLFALCTIVGFFVQNKKPPTVFNGVFGLYLLFVVWVTVSSFTHNGFDPHIWDRYDRFIKASLFFLFAALIIEKKIHIEAIAWALVLSVGVKVGSQGVAVILSGGGHRAVGISNAFNDNNLAALATLMVIPFMVFLFLKYKKQIVMKYALLAGLLSNIAFIMGSESRGAFLGLLVLGGFFFMKSDRKGLVFTLICIVSILALSLVDQDWLNRMDTMNELGEDSSFQGRVIAWKMHTLMALHDPFFGGGFDSASYGPMIQILMFDWSTLDFISSPYPSKIHVAHSIYFQILGDTGFGGAFIYFSLMAKLYLSFQKYRKNLLDNEMKDFAMYSSLSVISFLVAGAALSAAYNEIILALLGLQVGLTRFYLNQEKLNLPSSTIRQKPTVATRKNNG